jgi:DMSO reductase anchor subunit
MRPAFSVVFLTTLIGAGQGLFLALYLADLAGRAGWLPVAGARFLAIGAAVALVLGALGLLASFFHLGRPERAWRAAARWRSSWLSREVIALPMFLAATAAWGAATLYGREWNVAAGAIALVACLALYYCTAMIYAGIRFLQEWASPLTVANFFLIGVASGTTLAAALAVRLSPAHAKAFALAALTLTAAALATRIASLVRNAHLRPRSTPQSAIGIRAARIEQKSVGFSGGSFNTHEFFHGVARRRFDAIRAIFIVAGFLAPMAIVGAALAFGRPGWLLAAPLVQYAGLVAERWFFLAQATHPQNLYYQAFA